jgi:hypothetical protein
VLLDELFEQTPPEGECDYYDECCVYDCGEF